MMTTIVIVDDRVTNRNILERLSQSLKPGAVVKSFGDAVQALAWMADHQADIVITDYKMPVMNGADFIRRCFTDLPGFDIPIIVVTAYEDKDFRYEALEAGATDFLLTPIDYREFRTRVQNLLAMRKHRAMIKDRAETLEQQLAVAISERTRIIRDSERQLRDVIDGTANLIFKTDCQGRLTLANQAFERRFGADCEEFLGKRLDRVCRDAKFAARCLENAASLIEAGSEEAIRFEVSLSSDASGGISDAGESENRDGGNVPISFQVDQSVLDRPDAPREILTVCTDITARKESERRAVEAKQRAELSDRSKTEFLANMSHELRTPLNAIIGFADMILHEVYGTIGNSRYRSYVTDIKGSANHLLEIIIDILDVSEVDAGKLRLRETVVDVERLCHEVARLVAHRATEQNVAVKVGPFVELPLMAADEAKLKQILVNLLVNAIKFTPAGGHIALWGEREPEGGILLIVEDNGIGMSKDDIEVAIARFGRVDNAFSHSRSGTGLGLPLAIDLARAHGGDIEVSSRPGVGTKVCVTLPPERAMIEGQVG
ncbi:ATP-binding protein [Fodinicurvata sp. EGI_FJ10296]|uniref:ATP-binding protein n=1 Tax=Fodinicurvata sp. EGI_FJ10296 TaxID=3231908 RepID=UPI0034569F03